MASPRPRRYCASPCHRCGQPGARRPFGFRAAGPAVGSALELVTCLAAASVPTFAWYGLTAASAAHELFYELTIAVPRARAWCAELRVGEPRANAAGIGSGCGVLLFRRGPQPVGSMRRAAGNTFAPSTSTAWRPMSAYTSRPASSHPNPTPAEDSVPAAHLDAINGTADLRTSVAEVRLEAAGQTTDGAGVRLEGVRNGLSA